MSETSRPGRKKGNGAERSGEAAAARRSATAAVAQRSAGVGPSWLGAGVARKMTVGESNAPAEREAEQTAQRVMAGEKVAGEEVASGGAAAARAMAADPPAPADDEAAPVQRAGKAEEKAGEAAKPPAGVQKADAADSKPPESKPRQTGAAGAEPAVQKAEKAPEKPREQPAPAAGAGSAAQPVQRAKPERSPGGDKPATEGAVQPARREDEAAGAKAEVATGPARRAEEPDSARSDKAASEAPVQKADVAEAETDRPAADTAVRSAPVASPGGVAGPAPGPAAGPGPGAAPAAAATTPAMESAAASAVSTRGAGAPLPAGVESTLESRMGADLGAVRVHDDSAAQAAADTLGARAFTHGDHIWLGRGESAADLGLMAHEATHVLQQTGGASRALVQRDAKKGAAGGAGKEPKADKAAKGAKGDKGAKGGKGAKAGDSKAEEAEAAEIKVEHDKSKITFPSLKVPGVADKDTFLPTPLVLTQPEPRIDQRADWQKKIDGPGVSTMADEILTDKAGVDVVAGDKADPKPKKLYFLKLKGVKSYLIGAKENVKERMKLPNWTETGRNHLFDVDHIRELQLGGKNVTSNYQLLDASANRSSGAKISNEIDRQIGKAVAVEEAAGRKWPGNKDAKTIRGKYTLEFTSIDATMEIAGKPDIRYTYDDVANKGKHLAGLQVVTDKKEVAKLRGSPTQLTIYMSKGAGAPKPVPWGKGPTQVFSEKNWGGIKGFDLKSVTYEPGTTGRIEGNVLADNKTLKGGPVGADLQEIEGLQYTLALSPGSIRAQIYERVKEAKKASPFEVLDSDLTDSGLMIQGVIRPKLPFLRDGLEINLSLVGDQVTVSATLSLGDFKFPGPIKVTEGSLSLTAGPDGLELAGSVALEIERLAKGRIEAKTTAKGFDLNGEVNFDSKTFKPAKVTVFYRDGKFGGEGKLGIPSGTLKGVRSASIGITYDDGVFSADGTVEPDIPGVKQASLSVSYSDKDGLAIGGDLTLADMPGISGGSIAVKVAQDAGADRWKVSATGKATPKIPGVSAQITATYDDGAFDIFGTVGYERGMLKGSVGIGVTNRPIGDDGKPAGAPPEGKAALILYGGGSVTLKIAPWLQATAGIKFLPNGEVEVKGEIGLPAAIELFKGKKFDKNLFSINLDIPIVGVSVLGQRIGIFATIGGGLDLSAGIGPGTLEDLKLGVTYNPAREEDTKVSGNAKFVLPANAGLRLFVKGGLGVGIPIVSATAGLEVGGSLGIEGKLEAAAQIDWTPTKGLEIKGEAKISAEPKFKFDVTGYVLVEADLLLKTIELYSKRWTLASVEYGSGLRFGLSLPVHYKEGEPFDVSLDDIKFEVPDIDPMSVIKGLISRVV